MSRWGGEEWWTQGKKNDSEFVCLYRCLEDSDWNSHLKMHYLKTGQDF